MENLHGEGSDQIVANNFTQAECNRIRWLIGQDVQEWVEVIQPKRVSPLLWRT
jgi:hypothetical protein